MDERDTSVVYYLISPPAFVSLLVDTDPCDVRCHSSRIDACPVLKGEVHTHTSFYATPVAAIPVIRIQASVNPSLFGYKRF